MTLTSVAHSKIVRELFENISELSQKLFLPKEKFVWNLVHITMKYIVPIGLLFWLAMITNSYVLATPSMCVNDNGIPGPCPEGTNQESKQGELKDLDHCFFFFHFNIKNFKN